MSLKKKNVSTKDITSFFLVLTIFGIIFVPVSASIIQPPISREMAQEYAIEAFKESLIDPYDVEVTRVRKESVEHPPGSGNFTDAWYVAVKGKGTEKSSGELVGRTTGYTIIIETGEIIEGASVGAGLVEISTRDVILDGLHKLSTPILVGLGTVIIGVFWRKRAKATLY